MRVADLYFHQKQGALHNICGHCFVDTFGQDWLVAEVNRSHVEELSVTWLNMVASFSSIYRDLCICLSNLSVLFLSWFPLTFLNDIPHFLSTIWGIGGSSLSNAKQKYWFDFFPAGKDGGALLRPEWLVSHLWKVEKCILMSLSAVYWTAGSGAFSYDRW